MFHKHPLIPVAHERGEFAGLWRIAEPVCPGDFFDAGFGKLRQVSAVLCKADWPGYRYVESKPLSDERRIEIADGLERIANDFSEDTEFVERIRTEAALMRPAT